MIPGRPHLLSGSFKGRLCAASVLLAIAISACGGAAPRARAPGHSGGKSAPAKVGEPAKVGSVETGLASYYADSLAGNSTASGEPYEPRELTAAHRTLPFGTLVEVTREDGKSVVVRINDRGPFGSKKRIVDLSRAAAEKIGLVRAGVAKVTLRVVGSR